MPKTEPDQIPIRVQEAALLRLDDIYRHTRDSWGEAQADHYITGMFETFDRMEAHGVASKAIPAEFGVEGFVFRVEYHFIYWCRRSTAISVSSRYCMSGCISSANSKEIFATETPDSYVGRAHTDQPELLLPEKVGLQACSLRQ